MFLRLVINGEDAREAVIRRLSRVPLDDLHECMIKPWKPPRTRKQDKTLRMWHREVAADILVRTGIVVDPQTIHDHFFIPRFMPPKESIRIGGEAVLLPMRTSDPDNDRAGMKLAMDRYEAWCTEHNIELTIPDPEHRDE